ncbi:uncharacterized protein BX664DRAFT_354245 [Halteromyces radiatus]|uniref:uncharacterized protein n=1 Tax=Halteromyces radiatus TaxID=101107 RepID=UPI0022204748|nr:uncharacterized protein BX664DRAFT_354245 [Halteromyces radiatus]KAI8098717.1 hypothetical protein BX664DRAFT_354245 [Halteromyces radiatus]
MEVKKGSTLRRGGAGGRRTGRTINKKSVYEYTLRCAIRAFHEQLQPNDKEVSNKKQDRHTSVHLSSVGDMFGSITDSGNSKPDKLTKEVVRGLIRRLEDIVSGENTVKPEYLDKRFLTVVRQFQKVLQQHRYKPTGTINDLVIIFLKTSEVELKRDNPNPAVWYGDLNQYIARFAELVIATVEEDAPQLATPELMDKLNGFLGSSKRSTSDQRNNDKSTMDSFEALEKYPMVQTVKLVFDVDDLEHRKKLRELEPLCSESALLLDLKKCINNVHTNQPFPGRREDYASQQVYDNWQKREVKQLTELMKSLMLMNPNLSLGAGSETDVGKSNLLSNNNRSSIPNGDGDNRPESAFTYIPNDPRSYYRLLMDLCIEKDTSSNAEADRAKSSVLSQQSDELLRECWKTWRLSAPYRAVLYLELVKTRFEYEQLDHDDVNDATRALDRVIKENDVSTWAINDRESLIRVFEGLNHTLLHELADALSTYWKINPQWISDLIAMLDKIYENPAYLEDHANPVQQLLNLEEVVEGAAVERWRLVEREANNQEEDDLTNLLTLADKLIKEYVSLTNKKFKTPLKDIINVPGIIMARQMPYFALEIENWSYMPACKTAPIEVTFELYNKVLSLKRLYDQHGPKNKTVLFKVESWFLSHVRRWLMTTNDATLEWVENAIKQDEFTRINDTTLHSSSIVDLFSMFHQAVDFVQNLQWPNELQHCRFLTVLSKIIGVALEQYTYSIESMIMDDIFPQSNRDQESLTSSATFFGKAQQLIGSRYGKELETPPDFTKELCVKINDIEAARLRLDRLYELVDADDVAEYMREHSVPASEKVEQKNYLYSVKVVRAENLPPLDKNGLSDPYVVLEFGDKQSSRTKTVYETLNPRWDQMFDIWLDEKTVDVLAVVYDEDLIGTHDECGAVWFQLSPQYFDDYQTHELVLNLHPQGKLVLRVSMEGEKDDIQFWFGKAVRTLKRVENDTAGLIVDRMGKYMRQHLSRRTLDTLLGRERSFFSAFSKANTQVEPSLQDCEDCIAPVLDYLERNLQILNDNLSETNMQLVIMKIWKDILLTLEGIMLPPLSEHQSDMIPLDEYEMHVVFKWLELLKILFNGGEDGDAVPLDRLENSSYHALLAINAAYAMETDKLMEIYNTVLKNQVAMKMRGGRKTDRSKTVYQSRHTIAKKPKSQRKSVAMDLPSSETILRILRMRSGKHVRDFLHTEFERRNQPQQPQQQQQSSHPSSQLLDIQEESSANDDSPPFLK